MARRLTILSLIFVASVHADESLKVQKQTILLWPHKRGFQTFFSVPATTILPDTTKHDTWRHIVDVMNFGAQTKVNSKFDEIFDLKKEVVIDVPELMYRHLTSNYPRHQYQCNIEADYDAIGEVKIGLDAMAVFANGRRMYDILPTHLNIRQVGGSGYFEGSSASLGTCQLFNPSPMDTVTQVQLSSYNFTHTSADEESILVSVEGVVQASKVFGGLANSGNSFTTVLARLNDGAQVQLNADQFVEFEDREHLSIYMTRARYNQISRAKLAYQFKCVLSIPVTKKTMATYGIDVLKLTLQAKTQVALITQFPSVQVRLETGQVYLTTATVVACEKLSKKRSQELLLSLNEECTITTMIPSITTTSAGSRLFLRKLTFVLAVFALLA